MRSHPVSHLVGRRDFLQVGALGAFGLTLPQLLAARAVSAENRLPLSSFGKAKSCIFIFQIGGPPHQDTFDMKPSAPSEIRSAYRPIASSLSGFSVCEHMPKLAQQAHHLAVLRGVHHDDVDHNSAGYIALTGDKHPPAVFSLSGRGPRPDDRPQFGAVVTKLRDTQVPWVALPFVYSNVLPYAGQSAGFLGPRYEPLWVKDNVNSPDFRLRTLEFTPEMSADRLSQRHQLLSVSRTLDRVAHTAATTEMTTCQTRALEIVTAPQVRTAFRLDRESDRQRERYGRNLFGQSCLLARRLVEAGVPLVLVQSIGPGGPLGESPIGWDMHTKIFDSLKDHVFPVQDQGFATLLEDLATRGLLDETLVVWTTEFGRTPKINQYAGRDHWPFVYTVLLAGAGVKAGIVHGSSDKSAAYPSTGLVTPQDLAATIYHCLGIHPHTTIHDQQMRPFEVGIGGELIRPILT